MKDVKTLEQAVRDEIDAFVANGCEFSAYTITKNIRTKVNNDLLQIDNVPYEMIDGFNTQTITHDDVRACVHQISNNGGIVGYSKKWNTLPSGAGYWSWTRDSANSGTGFIADSANDSAKSNPAPSIGTVVVQYSLKTHKNPAGDPTDPMIQGKILSYIQSNSGHCVTYRDIQKRMKRNRLTVDQIHRIVQALNLRVCRNDKHLSKSYIV